MYGHGARIPVALIPGYYRYIAHLTDHSLLSEQGMFRTTGGPEIYIGWGIYALPTGTTTPETRKSWVSTFVALLGSCQHSQRLMPPLLYLELLGLIPVGTLSRPTVQEF